ncbi:DNA polymerase III subunit delta [Alkalihalophilus marmarensis]|uniref:DNA polymerase III subunit delta n=1 Tax=Alkalihalophilus marmarensis TaxID=521377 RepID=UPI002DBAEC51|nr:DNA polymerase III subunit delta [Alkalihalophilus marmarensis]MEC2073402.1 DNA polymerase III subunit delta [Alkalihalophilus marmarensis]
MKPIYLIFGDEPFLIEDNRFKITQEAVGEVDEFNSSSFDMEEEELTKAIGDAQTLSFMGGHRIITLKNCTFLSGNKTKLEQDVDALIRYVEEPNDMATLVLTLHADKLDARKKISKLLKKSENVEIITCQSLPPHKLKQWIQAEAESQAAGIEPIAIERLIKLLGSDLTALKQEIQKISLYNNGAIISEKHISQLVTSNIEESIFVLIDKIIKKDKQQAIELLSDMLKKKEEPIKIIALLVRQIRLILLVGELSSRGKSINQIAKELNMHSYPVQLAAENTHYYDPKSLQKHLVDLIYIDHQIKRGQTSKTIALEQFIATI